VLHLGGPGVAQPARRAGLFHATPAAYAYAFSLPPPGTGSGQEGKVAERFVLYLGVLALHNLPGGAGLFHATPAAYAYAFSLPPPWTGSGQEGKVAERLCCIWGSWRCTTCPEGQGCSTPPPQPTPTRSACLRLGQEVAWRAKWLNACAEAGGPGAAQPARWGRVVPRHPRHLRLRVQPASAWDGEVARRAKWLNACAASGGGLALHNLPGGAGLFHATPAAYAYAFSLPG
jgi:hypothetical protein